MTRSNHAIIPRPCQTLASASTETFDVETDGHKAIFLRVKTVTASGYSMTVTLSDIDPVNGDLRTLIASPAIIVAGTAFLSVGRALPVTANVSANTILPRKVRISVTHTDATSLQYSITGELSD